MEPDIVEMYDATDDDAYAEGDPTLEDMDVEAVTHLAAKLDAAQIHPEGPDRSLAIVGVLDELCGDDLDLR